MTFSKDQSPALPLLQQPQVRLLLILSLLIFVAECVVMVMLSYLPPLSTFWGAILDASLMLILISPPLYLLAFRPLMLLIGERKRAEESLQRSNDELESRVKERTADFEIANEDLQDEIAGRRLVEAETIRYMKNLEYISISATRFLEEQTYEEVFQYIAERLAALLKNEYVIVSEYDPAGNLITVRAVGGNEQNVQAVSRILQREVVGLALGFDRSTKKKLKQGMFVKVEGGIHDLTYRRLPEHICAMVEKELGVGAIFVMPLAWEDDLLGTVAILTHGKGLPENVRVIETIANQAAIALKRIRVEEERKRAGDALRRSAEDYRMLMDQASDGVLIVDAEGAIVAPNVRFCEMLGYEKGEVIAMTLQDLLPLGDHSMVPRSLRELNAGNTISVEHRLRRKDGMMIDVETNAKKLADGRIQGIIRDITVQKAKQQKFKQVVKGEAFEKLFTKLRAFKHGQSGAMNLNRLALFAENLEMFSTAEMPATSDKGMETVHSFILSDSFRRFEVAVDEFSDIVAPELRHIASLAMLTEMDTTGNDLSVNFLSTADTLLSLTENLKQRLAVVVAHTKGFDHDNAQLMGAALQANILSTIGRIRYTLGDISNYAEANFTCDALEVVRASARKFQSDSFDLCIDHVSLTHPSRAVFNISELGTVMSILIENSIEAFGNQDRAMCLEKPSIQIHTETDERCVRIAVQDNGPGIPKEIRDTIFQNGVSGKSEGRGFGLTYAKECVTKYSGRIFLDSTVHSGSRFVVEVSRAS